MPEDKPFHTKDLSAQIGSSRLSFAPPELMEELIRCTPGSASVLGLAYDTEHRAVSYTQLYVYNRQAFPLRSY